ncbi:hypothetical protein [Methylopila sp. Yamaguchi]|uniref:hypothetical protein n=1 Tax=Methylopila sp. Yamaguchi TaxID=1437817 RepID=UPI000CAEE7C5|nr:hypothetical protein [Methylopila sp. Yamaguchi]GBD47485.1 hypothetical protein METY_0698 [Methylopila sp. Yamaguchi]
MRTASLVAAALLCLVAAPARSACFDACFGSKVAADSDDIAVKDAATACRQSCDAEAQTALDRQGFGAQLKSCRAHPISLEEFRKVRGASPSYRVQSNIFLWDVKNPFPDKVLTKIEVSTQTMELNDLAFVGTGLVPPSSTATFVIPAFYEGYPAVRFSAKVSAIWACDLK